MDPSTAQHTNTHSYIITNIHNNSNIMAQGKMAFNTVNKYMNICDILHNILIYNSKVKRQNLKKKMSIHKP